MTTTTTNKIINKLLLSVKDEIKKDENMSIITIDIIQPIVNEIVNTLYPYFMIGCISFLILLLVIVNAFVVEAPLSVTVCKV